MTSATSTAFASPAASLWERLGSLRAAMTERVAQRRLYRTALAELDALSDRDLADLGLARADIGRVARQASALA